MYNKKALWYNYIEMSYITDLSKFEEYLVDRVSPNTVKVYMYALRSWFSVLNGVRPSQESAQAHIDKLTKAGRSASTVSLRGHAILRWFRWKGKPITLDCPTVRIGEPEYLVLEQIEKLLAVCNTVLEETLITVLFDTAVRISELLNLGLDNIDWDGKFISVVRKGGRREEVNISDKALETLSAWLDVRQSESKRVFMDLTYWDAWNIVKVVGKRVDIKVHPHIFRHSRAIHMLMNGADIRVVKDHLGHKNIATTINIYGRFMAVHLKELVPTW